MTPATPSLKGRVFDQCRISNQSPGAVRHCFWHRIVIVASLLTAGPTACSLFDSGTEWENSTYKLAWTDTSDNMSLSRKLPGGNTIGRVDATVYAIGANARYVVVKQHPGGDRSKTLYFIVDVQSDTDHADPKDVVEGPLTESQYRDKAAVVELPQFSKTLAWLQ